MVELRESPSTGHAGSSTQVSFDIEDVVAGNENGNVDETSQKKQKHERPCVRHFLCVLLGTTVLFCVLATTLYFTVLQTTEQPSLTSGGVNSTFPAKWLGKGPKPNGVVSKINNDKKLSSSETENDVKNDDCPADWTYYNKKCYHFSRIPVNMSDAKIHCLVEGGIPLKSNETEAVREFMGTEIRNLIGCCLRDKSRQRNEPDMVANVDEKTASSLSFLYDPDWSDTNNTGFIADENSEITTRSSLFDQNSLTSHLPATPPSLWGRSSQEEKDVINSTLKPSAPTPTSKYGFWLGAGHQHHHHATTGRISDRTTTPNRPDNWAHKMPPKLLFDQTTQSISVKRRATTSPNIRTQNHGSVSHSSRDPNNTGPMSMNMSDLEILCSKYEIYLPTWRYSDCLENYVQICERNPV